jgi:hypothetical protein
MTSAVKLSTGISGITDSSNRAIPEGGSTVDSTVHVLGKSQPHHEVELFDGANLMGLTKGDVYGAWTFVLSELKPKAYAVRAKSDGQYSVQRTFTVKVSPVIAAVTDSAGNSIPNGGTTTASEVQVKGHAEAGQSVELFNNNSMVLVTIADARGQWSASVTRLKLGQHDFQARSKSDEGRSDVWSLTVVAAK